MYVWSLYFTCSFTGVAAFSQRGWVLLYFISSHFAFAVVCLINHHKTHLWTSAWILLNESQLRADSASLRLFSFSRRYNNVVGRLEKLSWLFSCKKELLVDINWRCTNVPSRYASACFAVSLKTGLISKLSVSISHLDTKTWENSVHVEKHCSHANSGHLPENWLPFSGNGSWLNKSMFSITQYTLELPLH